MTDRASETTAHSAGPESNELVTLCIPADTRHAATARVVAASLAADLGFDVDQIDDLRLGVNEAVALVVDAVSVAAASRRATPLIEITFAVLDRDGSDRDGRPTLEIEIGQRWTSGDADTGDTDTGPVDVELDELADRILSAVVDRHSHARGAVRLTSSRRTDD